MPNTMYDFTAVDQIFVLRSFRIPSEFMAIEIPEWNDDEAWNYLFELQQEFSNPNDVTNETEIRNRIEEEK